jgi:HlyD family secretion protein
VTPCPSAPARLILGLLGLALVAALVWIAFRTDPVPVDLAEVTQGPLSVTIDADGQTRIREVYEVASPIAGIALRAPVRVGDATVADETVVAIVQPVAPAFLDARSRQQAEAAVQEAEASRAVAQSQVRQAEEDLSYAESQLARARTLVERGVATTTQLEDATQRVSVRHAALDAARSNLALAEGSLARAEAALIEPTDVAAAGGPDCCIHIRAPATGRVLSVPVVSERPVLPGATLATIGAPDDLEIVADLLSSDAVRLAPGATAEVDRWGGPEPLAARLVRIEPSARTKVSALGIEEQRVDAVFEITSPPSARTGLGDGFSVFLRIVEWQTEDAVQVPLSALWRSGETWAVFVVENGRAQRREVEIGRRNARQTQVIAGLTPGETVITHPSDDVASGVAIVDRATLRE